MLRQQVLIIGRKKDQFAENLKDLRSEHNSLEKQLKEKRKHLGDDGEILRGEDVSNFRCKYEHTDICPINRISNVSILSKFKRYVIKLRSKGNTYKTKRQEIAELQAEYVTLKRTEEIIKKKFDSVKDHLVNNFSINF